jgi:hypothetical protein
MGRIITSSPPDRRQTSENSRQIVGIRVAPVLSNAIGEPAIPRPSVGKVAQDLSTPPPLQLQLQLELELAARSFFARDRLL